MRDREPTVRSHELGRRLRHAMEYAGYNGTQIADELGWSQGRVSRLLAGKRGGSGYDVSAFLAACGIKGAEHDRLMDLSSEHVRRDWFMHHDPALPKEVQPFVDLETKALFISEFQTTQIPHLLQTSEYAHATISRSANIPQEKITDRVYARLARQELLNRPRAPSCAFFLHENAIRAPIGGPAVMSDQLHYLLRIAVRPNITLRIVPAHLGAHAGMAGPFTLLEIRDFKPIIYLQNETSSLFLELRPEVNAYRNILTSLDKQALDEALSRQLLGTIAFTFSEGNTT
jgi:transcriptional regulator with XRE-family HTH domain